MLTEKNLEKNNSSKNVLDLNKSRGDNRRGKITAWNIRGYYVGYKKSCGLYRLFKRNTRSNFLKKQTLSSLRSA